MHSCGRVRRAHENYFEIFPEPTAKHFELMQIQINSTENAINKN
jgi:hypothetical protein